MVHKGLLGFEDLLGIKGKKVKQVVPKEIEGSLDSKDLLDFKDLRVILDSKDYRVILGQMEKVDSPGSRD